MTGGAAAFAGCVAVVLSGCNLAPTYERPKAAAPTSFKEAAPGNEADQGWKLADPKDEAIGSRWWEVYQDPRLNDLEQRVAISNQTVVAAEANYRSARALVSEAEASLYPTLNLVPSAVRSRSSASVASINSTNSPATGTGGVGTGAGNDPWRSHRHGHRHRNILRRVDHAPAPCIRCRSRRPTRSIYGAACAIPLRRTATTRWASAADVETALLSTQSQLAQAYFELRITDEERRLLDTTLEDYRASLHLVQTLFNNGLASDEDIAEADTQLASAEAQATDLGVARAQYEHAIAVLIGVPPANFSLPYAPLRQALRPSP